jgi:hypothetical protein
MEMKMPKDHGSKVMQKWAKQANQVYYLVVGRSATIFARMCADHGVRGACRRLVMSGEIESGLVTCFEYGIEKWSVEWAVTHLFPNEFTDDERRWAQTKFNETAKMPRKRKAPRAKVADPQFA